jgi:hypothetical protein
MLPLQQVEREPRFFIDMNLHADMATAVGDFPC